jgi:hypothetical protein
VITTDDANIIEIPGLLRSKTYKKLTFKKEGLTIEKTSSFDPAVFIPAENIISFRYGVNWIRGYKFVFGRQYIIQIQDSNKKIFSIKLSSYYQIRRKAYHKIWSSIFTKLWDNYYVNVFNYYNDLYSVKQEFELADVKFYPFGIMWEGVSLFWNEIALSNYKTYFMIHHRNDLKKIKRVSFKNDWNAFILQCVLKKIIEEHNSYRGSPVI